jgi:hypothetical protein|tara:strand:+ start:512 stop:775 length:264 start_codon:yes stop_codon:yes gene_type:complete
MKKKSKKIIRGKIFVSPDGGETVYEQNKDGSIGKLVSKTQLAKDIDTGRDEEEMIGPTAIELRRKYPALKKAWDQYRTVWGLIAENE